MADTVRELVIKVTVDSDTKPLDDLGKKSQSAQTKAVALGTVLGGLATKLADVAIEAAKAAVALGKDLVFGVSAAADEIAKTSAKLGVGSDQLQRLRGAAELSGAEISSLDSGLRDLQKNIGESLEKGAGPGTEALATLGLTVEEVNDLLQSGDIEGTLGLIGDAANDLNDPVRKQAALLKLMGGAGGELGPLLASGSEGIKLLGDRIEATGEIIDKEALAQFEALQDNLRDVEGRIQGVKNQIGIALAPVVSDIADRIEGWIDANSEFIDQQLPVILDGVADALRVVADLVEQVVAAVLPAVAALGEMAGETLDKVIPAVDRLAAALGPVIELIGSRLAAALEGLGPILGSASDQLVFLADTLSLVLETGNAVLEWADELASSLEERWPRAFAAATKVVNAIASPLDTVRDVAREIVEWLEEAVPQIGEIAKIINRIKATLGFGEESQSIVSEDIPNQQFVSAFGARGAQPAPQRPPEPEVEKKKKRRGGGAGKSEPAEATIGELIANSVGGAAPETLRSAAAALTGTLLVTNIVTSTVNVGGIVVGAAVPADVAPEIVNSISLQVLPELARQTRVAVETMSARNNVGP